MLKLTREARALIEEIRHASSIEDLEEIANTALPWLDRAMTDDEHWIREALADARERIGDQADRNG